MINYEPHPGTSIDQAVEEALALKNPLNETIAFDFNGSKCFVDPRLSLESNRLSCRKIMGLPSVDIAFHPVTAKDALERWDKGETVFTIEMGGLGPGYEQAIQILIFEIVRDNLEAKLPDFTADEKAAQEWYSAFGNASISRVDQACGGFSGAQVGAAKQVAYRALRDGWGKMLESVPDDRKIQVSKSFPKAP